MQLLNINTVINEIKNENPEFWRNYIDKLVANNTFTTNIPNEHLYEGIWICNAHEYIELRSADRWSGNLWTWKDRGRYFIEFVKIEKIFIDKMNTLHPFCPYCGKIPLITYDNDSSERRRTYDLDHIYLKNEFTYLTFNLYNLVPICKICNQLKASTNFYNKREYFHPYFWFVDQYNKTDKSIIFDNSVSFSCDWIWAFVIGWAYWENTKIYKLDKIYPTAQDTKNDIKFIRDKQWHILSYWTKLDSIWVTDKRKFFFKNYYPEKSEDILKFANGKLKKDMINSLKL